MKPYVKPINRSQSKSGCNYFKKYRNNHAIFYEKKGIDSQQLKHLRIYYASSQLNGFLTRKRKCIRAMNACSLHVNEYTMI